MHNSLKSKKFLPLVVASTFFFSGCEKLQEGTKKQEGNNQLEDQPVEVKKVVASRLDERLEKLGAITKNDQPDKYALLVNSSNELRFVTDTSLAYQVLLEQGFRKENIFALGFHEKEEFHYPQDGIANRGNMEKVCRYLERVVDEKDVVVVNISNHGDRKTEKITRDGIEQSRVVSTARLVSDDITENDLEKWLSPLNPKAGLALVDTCYGGGFARAVGKKKFVGIAQTADIHVGYSEVGNSFGGFFYLAFRNKKASDKNNDGIVTFDEAFNYAKSRHTFSVKGSVYPQCFYESDITKASLE